MTQNKRITRVYLFCAVFVLRLFDEFAVNSWCFHFSCVECVPNKYWNEITCSKLSFWFNWPFVRLGGWEFKTAHGPQNQISEWQHSRLINHSSAVHFPRKHCHLGRKVSIPGAMHFISFRFCVCFFFVLVFWFLFVFLVRNEISLVE